jgi:hypothetical protein
MLLRFLGVFKRMEELSDRRLCILRKETILMQQRIQTLEGLHNYIVDSFEKSKILCTDRFSYA